MKVKNKMVTKSLLFLSLACFAHFSWAKGGVGNGGGLHLCGPDSKYTTDFYDLFEGRERYDLTIEDTGNNETEEAILKRAIRKLAMNNQSLASRVQGQLDYLAIPGNFILKQDLIFKKTKGVNELFVAEGCEYEPLATWDDESGKVFAKERLFNLLNTFKKAAFKLHEAISTVARMTKNFEDATQSRHLNEELLSNSTKLLSVEDFRLAGDIVGSNGQEGIEVSDFSEHPNFHMDFGFINMGQVNFEDDQVRGTIKITLREWKSNLEKKKELLKEIEQAKRNRDSKKVKNLNQELNDLVEHIATKSAKISISDEGSEFPKKIEDTKNYEAKLDVRGGSTRIYLSASSFDVDDKISVDIEFAINDETGRVLKRSLELKVPAFTFANPIPVIVDLGLMLQADPK